MSKQGKSFLWEFHYFRAIAILAIIIGHIWANPKTSDKDSLDILRETLFDGSTIYFILISGFLFQHLSRSFKPYSYYLKKLKYIILPYIFFILVFHSARAFGGKEIESLRWFFGAIPIKLLHGMGPLWYIPFISVLFLLTPLFYRIPEHVKVKVLPFLLLLPLLGTRTDTEITLGQFVYFTPIYLFGMYASIRYVELLQFVERFKKGILSSIVVLTAILLIFWIKDYQELYQHSYLGLLYTRNMLVALFIIWLLHRRKNTYSPLMDKIAIYSFALFFTHDFLNRRITSKLLEMIAPYVDNFTMILLTLVYIPVFVLFNYYILYLAKKILGRKSRYIIGA